MMKIEYDAVKGLAIRDGDVEQFVADALAGGEARWRVANENVIDRLRLAVIDCEIAYDEIRFYWRDPDGFEHQILVDPFGSLSEYPLGFADCQFELTGKLLDRSYIRKQAIQDLQDGKYTGLLDWYEKTRRPLIKQTYSKE